MNISFRIDSQLAFLYPLFLPWLNYNTHTNTILVNQNQTSFNQGFIMNKYKISHLRAKRKADLFGLCLKEYGLDTAYYYKSCTKEDMVGDLMLIERKPRVKTARHVMLA